MSSRKIKQARKDFKEANLTKVSEIKAFAKERGLRVRNLELTRTTAHAISGADKIKPTKVRFDYKEPKQENVIASTIEELEKATMLKNAAFLQAQQLLTTFQQWRLAKEQQDRLAMVERRKSWK